MGTERFQAPSRLDGTMSGSPELGSHVERLIAGLLILATYNPDLHVHPCSRARRSVSVQEEEFGDISEADRTQLTELGWVAGGVYLWMF